MKYLLVVSLAVSVGVSRIPKCFVRVNLARASEGKDQRLHDLFRDIRIVSFIFLQLFFVLFELIDKIVKNFHVFHCLKSFFS